MHAGCGCGATSANPVNHHGAPRSAPPTTSTSYHTPHSPQYHKQQHCVTGKCNLPESGWLAIIIRRCASFTLSSGALSLMPRIMAASRRVMSGKKPPCGVGVMLCCMRTATTDGIPITCLVILAKLRWCRLKRVVCLNQCSTCKCSGCNAHANHQRRCLRVKMHSKNSFLYVSYCLC